MKKIISMFVVAVLLAVMSTLTSAVNICPTCNYHYSCDDNAMFPAVKCNESYRADYVTRASDIRIGDIIWFKIDKLQNIDFLVRRVANIEKINGETKYTLEVENKTWYSGGEYFLKLNDIQLVMR